MENLIKQAIQAAILGGEKILSVYQSSNFGVQIKEDNSPVTDADKNSSTEIVHVLEKTNIPILCEEIDIPVYKERKKWEKLWIVDPLDGTKEFIAKNDEFTINIGYIENEKPVFGIIYIPVTGEIFYGGKNIGSFKLFQKEFNPQNFHIKDGIQLPINQEKRKTLVVTGSKSHSSKQTEDYFNQLKQEYKSIQFLKIGSAIKFCRMAENLVDLYPRFQDCMEWDTAAGHAILQGVKKEIWVANTNTPLVYNKENLYTPYFIAK